MMNVLLILLATSFLQSSGHVTGQFTAPPPTCPDDKFTFRCTVTGDRNGITIWRVNGSSECSLVHNTASAPGPCGVGSPFTVGTGTGFGTSATSFTSSLSGTANSALNDTLIECFGPTFSRDAGNMVGSSTVQIFGPPSSVSTLSCVDLSGDINGAVNVTVSWTLSGGDSADFYLINITTNAPQTPYGGLLNITTGSVTQHELTGFMADYEYDITARGVNCGSQEGRESEPLMITPQVPMVSSSCNITLLYKSTGRLEHIDSTWDSVSVPTDPGEACPGPSGNITQYWISFQTGSSVVATENVNIAECTAGRCSHTFEPPSNPPSSYDSVSVAAENVVGVGAVRACTTQTIHVTNNLITGDVILSNGTTLNCAFLSGFTGSARCTVQYGTDPTYMNLPYSAESTETGTAGDTVSVVLRERLNSTDYYFNLSAVSGGVNVVVQGNFTTTVGEHTVCYQRSLLEWGIALIVIGVLALVVAVVIIIRTLFSYTWKNKRTQWKFLYFTLVVITLLFGVALWIAVGVVNLNSSTCDASWELSESGLIISGFVASIMALIFTTAAVVWVYIHKKTDPVHHAEPIRRDEEVNMQALEEDRYTTTQHGHISSDRLDQTHSEPIPDGVMYADLGHNTPSAAVSPPDIDDNVQYSLLAHDQRMAKQILDSAGAK